MEVDFHARVTEYQGALRRLRIMKGEVPNNKVIHEKIPYRTTCVMPGFFFQGKISPQISCGKFVECYDGLDVAYWYTMSLKLG